jgi:hypothetical protein
MTVSSLHNGLLRLAIDGQRPVVIQYNPQPITDVEVKQ